MTEQVSTTLYLPYDVLDSVLDQVSADRDLARCCLTSKALLSVAQPRLYDTVHVRFLVYKGYGPLGVLDPKTNILLSTLRQSHHLGFLVRTVKWEGLSVSLEHGYEAPPRLSPREVADLFNELLRLFPSVKRYWLIKIPQPYQANMDEVIQRFQGARNDNRIPSFNLSVDQHLRPSEAVPRAAYEGFEQTSPPSIFGFNLSLATYLG
ncbi:uncharacterized protein JCM6883_004180 [Sporobolomyces salmoneus]|uniref:uncharacterized protein n=1 Tax=Sporobolomyces salmoneus TaxID=183962 RepID=UPI0031739D39